MRQPSSGDSSMRRPAATAAQHMATDSLNTTHRVLSLAQQIAINDPSEIRSIGAVIQGKQAPTSLSEQSKKLAELVTECHTKYGVSDTAIRKLGSDLEMVVAFHQLAQLQVNSFVNENNHLDPILAFQKAISVPRNHVASTFKASWQAGHDSLFNSQFNSNMFSTVGSMGATGASGNIGQSMATSTRLRSQASVRAGSRRGKGVVVEKSYFMYTLIFVLAVLAVSYIGARTWDAVELYNIEKKVGWLIYRLFVIISESLFAGATIAYLRLATKFAAAVQPRVRRTFTPEALVSILYTTDETADTIVAAVMSHTHARRPRRIPIKLIVIAQTYTQEVIAAQTRVSRLISNVTFLDHQQLADHEPVTRLLDDAVPIIEMMAVPRLMTMGQALYLCLTGINIKYPLDNVLVSVSEASVIVNQSEHYKYAISKLSRADTAVVSFPSVPRNEKPLADLLDLQLRDRQNLILPASHIQGHCIVHSLCFSARGPELFSVLRAMELENAGSRTFDWLPFFIHMDPTSAKSAAYDTAAPLCSVLVHKHGRSRLASKIFSITESWDVAAFLSRQFGFRWSWTSAISVPHMMNKMTLFLEATILIVMIVTISARIPPASPANVLLSVTFLIYYLTIIVSGAATPFGFRRNMVGRIMTSRILVPFFATIYTFAISRFGVDRRGHFQSVGDITTAQIFGLKQKDGTDADDLHVPLMAVPQDIDAEPSASSESDLWNEEEPDAVTVDSWASLGFSSTLQPAGGASYNRPGANSPHSANLGYPEITPVNSRGLTPTSQRTPRRNPLSAKSARPSSGRGNTPGSGARQGRDSRTPFSPVHRLGFSSGRRGARPLGEAVEEYYSDDEILPAGPLGEAREGSTTGVDDCDLSARLAHLATDQGLRSGPLNSFNEWKAPPPAEVLPQKVSRQEFVDHTAASAAKQPGSGQPSKKSGGDGSDSLDMRNWTGDRTAAGIVAGLSTARIAVAALFAGTIVAIALGTAAVAVSALLGSEYTHGYTHLERVAADPWDVVAVLLGVLVIIPPVILLANIALPRFLIRPLIHNRVSASILLLVSLLALVGIPAVHVFANMAGYDEFSTTFNFDPVPVAEFGSASGAFLALQRTGPVAEGAEIVGSPYTVRGAADVGVVNPSNGASLAGGFITGPGNAKVTHVAATAMCDMALAMLRFPAETKAMVDVPGLLMHGAEYLTAAYNAADGSLVSAVYDTALTETSSGWRRIEQVPAAERQVSLVNGTTATEIYALTSAALAAAAQVLRIEYDGQAARLETVAEYQALAKNIFDTHVDRPGASYAAVDAALNATWPTAAGQVQDKQYYAAAWLYGIFPDDPDFKSVLNYYFSYAEETHDWRPCTVDMDNFFVAANVVMSHFETFDTRYRLHVERCVAAWTGETIFRGDTQSSLIEFVGPNRQFLLRRTVAGGESPDVAGPRPLPLGLRAMAIVANSAADRLEPVEIENRRNVNAACFSMQQLRIALGYNDATQSFIAGVAAPGARMLQQPRVRSATCAIDSTCGDAAVQSPDANPTIALGALVNGPTLDGAFSDNRLVVENAGTGILNSSPMLLLAAAHERLGLQPQDCLAMGRGVGRSA